MDRKYLEARLVDFAFRIINLCKSCEFDEYTYHLPKQIVRSSSSTALNYGEAQSAESRADFVHKLSIVLKELRETHINLIILEKSGVCREKESLAQLLKETNELVAIFQKSVSTLKKTGNIRGN
jgi:four helix bundle protein